MRTRIAACSPRDAVAVPSLAATAACLATWAGGLLFGADGIAGLRFRYARGCLPRPRDRLGRRDRSGFDQGLLLSRRAPRVSEGLAKPPHCRALRFAPVAPRGARGESVPDAGASPRRLQNALASRKRHLGVGSHHPWLPRQRRISAGCLVSQSVGAPSDHAAIQRQRSAFSLPLAPKRHQRRVLSSP